MQNASNGKHHWSAARTTEVKKNDRNVLLHAQWMNPDNNHRQHASPHHPWSISSLTNLLKTRKWNLNWVNHGKFQVNIIQVHQWRLMQVTAWYLGRKTTSSRQITTSGLTTTVNTAVWTRRSTIQKPLHGRKVLPVISGVEYSLPVELSWIFNFSKLQWPERSEGQTASPCKKFVVIRQTVVDIWQFFNFLRWRPSTILDLWCANLDHTRRAFGGLLSLCKIWFESVKPLPRYEDFSMFPRWRPPPSWIFKIPKS